MPAQERILLFTETLDHIGQIDGAVSSMGEETFLCTGPCAAEVIVYPSVRHGRQPVVGGGVRVCYGPFTLTRRLLSYYLNFAPGPVSHIIYIALMARASRQM